MAQRRLNNIVIVLPSLTLGGAERQALRYARFIKESGIGTPIVIGLGRSGALVPTLEEVGIAHHTLPMVDFSSGSRVQKAMQLFRWWWQLYQLRPSAVIGFTHWPNVLCGLVWRWTGAKAFYWNQRSVDTDLPMTIWERMARRKSPIYVSNGMAGAKFISQRHGVPLSDVVLVPNVVELPYLCPAAPQQGAIQLLMTANFFPEKDHATVLHALATYLKREDARLVHLHLVGTAPGRSTQMITMKALAFDLGLCGKVTFHGTVSDMAPLLINTHIGILSTRSEGVSNAILEYMAHGLPVLATDIDANREALGPHNKAWLFAVGDTERLTSLLVSIIHHLDRHALGMANRTYVEQRHSEMVFSTRLRQLLVVPSH
jgi:glycosyltransferase involved in cell wall biosynthesis